MKSIHIRQIDDAILDALKRRAHRHRRSLQKEIESLLADAARMTPPDATAATNPLDALHSVATGRRAMTWTRESYYDEDGR